MKRKDLKTMIVYLLTAAMLTSSCQKELNESVNNVTINQQTTSPELRLNKNDLSFSADEGNDSFSIVSNTNWFVKSDQSWCTLSSSSGSNDGTIIVRVLENASIDSRSASITVRTGNVSQTIAVMQAGAKPVDESTKTFTVNDICFKMIRVYGDTFMMGATSEQGSDTYDNEKPAHQVTLSSYYIGETEVTQALWQAVMGSNPSFFSGMENPVEQVSWDDCQEFIRYLNSLTGQNFRLPTEAEWEYAARGGNMSQGYKYAGSNTIDNVAWYVENSNEYTHKVATKTANELGLYDMSGNVWEWCQDWYDSYNSSNQTNPTGPRSGDYCVCRGGCWNSSAVSCRVSLREADTPSKRRNIVGLRLAL